jgi:hypothetical protein
MGLGKRNEGSATHVKVERKHDAHGVGFRPNAEEPVHADWHMAYKRVSVRVRRDSVTSERSDGAAERAPSSAPSKEVHEMTDAELFDAVGGRRLGMRARIAQPGKWRRAEQAGSKRARDDDDDGAVDDDDPTSASGAGRGDPESSDAADGAEREEKRRKKDKREKKEKVGKKKKEKKEKKKRDKRKE